MASSVYCPTQRTYTMTLTNTAYQTSVAGRSSYQSLYSEERRDLHLLEVRKETFIFYPQSNIPTADIAAAGFYYTGDEYVIKCYCCKLTVTRPNNNPFTIHQSRAPNCPFVRKTVTQGAHTESDSSLLNNAEDERSISKKSVETTTGNTKSTTLISES